MMEKKIERLKLDNWNDLEAGEARQLIVERLVMRSGTRWVQVRIQNGDLRKCWARAGGVGSLY